MAPAVSLLVAPGVVPQQWALRSLAVWGDPEWKRYARGRRSPLAVVAGGVAWWRLAPGVLWSPIGAHMPVWRGSYDVLVASLDRGGVWSWSVYRHGQSLLAGRAGPLSRVLADAYPLYLREV